MTKNKKMTKREKEIRRVILLNCLFDEEKRRTKIEQEAERLHIAGQLKYLMNLMTALLSS